MKLKHPPRISGSAIAPILVALASPALAGGPDAAPPPGTSTYSWKNLWDLAVLHKDDANPILQEFKLRGRYHGQYHKVDADQGTAEGWEDRRSRLGFDAKLFEKRLEIRADFQSNDGFEDAYDRLVDAYLRWKPSDSLAITFGKTKPLIGYYDWLQSTNSQPTFERSQIFNQLNIDRATALTIEGKAGRFTWQTGLYSNDVDREFGQFDASWSASAGLGYDLAPTTGLAKSDLRVDWLHSDRDAATNVLGRYDDVVSATLWLQDGPWSFVAEAYLATGGTGADGDVFGGFLQGTWDLVPGKLQLVGRWSAATGDGPTSVRRQTRYESEAVNGRGDTYQALYLGGQYFINGDKLKLLAGAEYASLDGGPADREYDGFTYLAGVRFSF